jgi:hypothetical protein
MGTKQGTNHHVVYTGNGKKRHEPGPRPSKRLPPDLAEKQKQGVEASDRPDSRSIPADFEGDGTPVPDKVKDPNSVLRLLDPAHEGGAL